MHGGIFINRLDRSDPLHHFNKGVMFSMASKRVFSSVQKVSCVNARSISQVAFATNASNDSSSFSVSFVSQQNMFSCDDQFFHVRD